MPPRPVGVDSWTGGTLWLDGAAAGSRLWGQSDEAPKAVDEVE
jgi:hypothetical protein